MNKREAAEAEDCWVSHYGADRTVPFYHPRQGYEDRLGNDLIDQWGYEPERAYRIAAEWMAANVTGGLRGLGAERSFEGCLYHVTYLGNLRSIAREGLRPNPGYGNNFTSSYLAHSRGRTFLTEHAGIFFWYGKLEDHAEHNHENVLDAGAIPVVLAVLGPLTVDEDPHGQQDARADAFFTKEVIPPSQLAVWNGEDWYDLDDDAIDLVDPMSAVRIEEEVDDYEDSDSFGETLELVYFRDTAYDNTLAHPEPFCED